MDNYFIKKGYKCNLVSQGHATPYMDDKYNASTFQINVYRFASKVILWHKLKTVLDIGCGFGIKLQQFIKPVCKEIVGIDTKHAIDFCRKEYRFGEWFVDDIENPGLKMNRKFDLIISSDVIEHLVDPDHLLRYIKNCCHEKTEVIISTPERDLTRGKKSLGPPANQAHIREWNSSEFRKYISNRGFKILKHFLVGEKGEPVFEIIKKIVFFRPLKKCQVIHGKLDS